MNKQHDNHIEARIARIEESVGKIRESAGASQRGIEEILTRMARTAAEWDAALDALQTAVVTAVTSEADQIKAEIERLKGLVGPDLEPQFARATQMATDFAAKIGQVWEAEVPAPEP